LTPNMLFYARAIIYTLISSNFLLAVSLLAAVPASASSTEREFIAAREAFDRRDIAALAIARDRFSNKTEFVLTPYVTFWWLSSQLSQASLSENTLRALSDDIEKFISANPNTPFTEQLQRDYLRGLARFSLWPQFAANVSRYSGDDNEVACQRLIFRLRNDDRATAPAVLSDAKAIWETNRPAADACYTLFQRLLASKNISNTDVWQRTRVLFENGQMNDARRSASLISNLAPNFEAASASANLDAKRFLDRHNINGNDRTTVELALFAITRMARTSAENAAAWLTKNESKLPKEDAQYAWAQIGYFGALQLDDDALRWFQRAGRYDLNDTQAAWFVRAALRETAVDESQWVNVRLGVLMMSASERRESAWRYWLARALSESKVPADIAQARTLREALGRENNFYGVLAAEEIGATPMPNFQGYQPTDIELAQVMKRGGVQRAFLLYRLAEDKVDLRNDALREWQFTIRGMDDQTLLAAAEAARRQDLPDRAINTAERTQSLHDFAQRYPLPHRESLQASAKVNNLDEAWVFGLIRQESRFITDARSRVGAQGLMQLMPATAQWVAKQSGMKDYTFAKVTDVKMNLSLGSFYLRHVLDDLGHPVLATAAYNAGPGRARRWRANTPLEGAIYAESIPFNETRDYVKKVMVNKWFYSLRIHGKAPKLSEIMGTVPSKTSARASIDKHSNKMMAAAPAALPTTSPSPTPQ
jgi:soluble lytic murein transglycosylase